MSHSQESSPNFASNINPLSTDFTKWSNTLKQFVGKLPTNCLSVFDHFVGLALKVLSEFSEITSENHRFSDDFKGNISELIRLILALKFEDNPLFIQ